MQTKQEECAISKETYRHGKAEKKDDRHTEKLCYRFLNTGKTCRFGPDCWFQHKRICKLLLKYGECKDDRCKEGHNLSGICSRNRNNKQCMLDNCKMIHVIEKREEKHNKRTEHTEIAGTEEYMKKENIKDGQYHLRVGNLAENISTGDMKSMLRNRLGEEARWMKGHFGGMFVTVNKLEDAQCIMNMNGTKIGGKILSVEPVFRCEKGLLCRDEKCKNVHHVVLQCRTKSCKHRDKCNKQVCSFVHQTSEPKDDDPSVEGTKGPEKKIEDLESGENSMRRVEKTETPTNQDIIQQPVVEGHINRYGEDYGKKPRERVEEESEIAKTNTNEAEEKEDWDRILGNKDNSTQNDRILTPNTVNTTDEVDKDFLMQAEQHKFRKKKMM